MIYVFIKLWHCGYVCVELEVGIFSELLALREGGSFHVTSLKHTDKYNVCPALYHHD